jgi:hypothetical protein
MKTKWIGGVVAMALLALAVAGMIASRNLSADEDEKPAKRTMSGARYTVVETEGHNLIVTDNQKEVLYFYTIEKDAKIGSELKLRGQLNLKQVGKKVIKPENVHLREDKTRD